MTHKKKEYQEPTLDVIKLRMPKLLNTSPNGDAVEDGSGARRYDFDE